MSTRLPEGPGRRALIKGGLAAAIAAALGSCGLGEMPAFAVESSIQEEALLRGMWIEVIKIQQLAESGQVVLTNQDVANFLFAYFRRNKMELPFKFGDSTIRRIKQIPDDDENLWLYLEFEVPGQNGPEIYDYQLHLERSRPAGSTAS